MQHCKDYFGEKNVSNIITFGTWSGKNLVQAVGKSIDADKDIIKQCSEYIPYSLSGALENEAFQEYLEDNEEAFELIEMCKPLEGCVKNASTHAAGMLIADSEITNYTPYASGKNGITSQYPFETLEKLGCLKVDLLGHEAEVVIDRACQYIEQNHGVKIIPREIPIDDKATYKMMQKCDMRGVPQLEKEWVLPIVQDVHPQILEHVIALVTMIRPGSLDSGQTDKYRAIRKGELEPTPDIPQVADIVKETYSCWLYQEQVMDVVKYCAGFTLGQADDLRKVVAKKRYKDKADKLMKLFKDNSIAGKGKSEPLTYEQWEIMDKTIRDFFKYAFNKAHGAGYGVTSYRCAYLKANYFIEYMTALINSKSKESLPFYLDNIYEHGYVLDKPDINVSGYYWTCEDGKLRPPLSVIANCGPSAVSEIVEERELNGKFKSFEDFISRTTSKGVRSNVISSLICVGAFDSLGYTIKTLFEATEETNYVKQIRDGKVNLFSKNSVLPLGGDEYTIQEIQEDEEYLMGFVISLSQDEINKRRNRLIRKVRKYRDYVYVEPNLNSSGRKLKMKSKHVKTDVENKKINSKRERILNKLSNSQDSETDNVIDVESEEYEIKNVCILLNTSTDGKLLSKIFKLNKDTQSDALKNDYNVTFIIESSDGNKYELKTKLDINAKCFVKMKKLLGGDKIWMEQQM